MKAAGIVGMGLWLPETIRRNDAWPESFVKAFREQRDARRRGDFTDIERRNPDRPYEELFLRHALPYDDDPFKGARERRIADPNVPVARGDAAAARLALAEAGIEPRDVDLVLSSAVVQDDLVPSNGPATSSRNHSTTPSSPWSRTLPGWTGPAASFHHVARGVCR